jgi:endogenous inhibitor of DNA gyrase (YacG/DUF329 family)
MYKCKCKQCGNEFEAITMFAQLCSPKCRQAKYRNTRKGKKVIKEYNKAYYSMNKGKQEAISV